MADRVWDFQQRPASALEELVNLLNVYVPQLHTRLATATCVTFAVSTLTPRFFFILK